MQRRIEICCVGKGRGEHPERLIATLTDNRRDVGDKAEFVTRAAAGIAELAELNDRSEQNAAELALGTYEVATRIGWIKRKTRRTADQRALYKTEADGLYVEETRKGRYFHFRCKSCGRGGDYMEAALTRFVDALHLLGRDGADLSELSNII